MSSEHFCLRFNIIYVIVPFGLGSKALKISMNHGISGGTIFLGHGTVKNRLLQILDLADVRKEIVMMLAERDTAHTVMRQLHESLHLGKPEHGIVFSLHVSDFKCIHEHDPVQFDSEGNDVDLYKAVYVVVEKGEAENVMEIAYEAGAKGGTIINARGSLAGENERLFSMDIEPEREIVLILTESALSDAVVSSLRLKLKIDEPGNGFMYVANVDQAYGIL